jgi:NAD(P)-dependent dehydrogenase (short-subunit alcohol dehydrogenase family)
MGKLDGKVSIITGGSGGIGRAAAKLFAAEGSRVILVDLDGDALEGVVAEIGADQAASVVADVSDGGQTQAYVAAAIEKFGGVDIALLNWALKARLCPLPNIPRTCLTRSWRSMYATFSWA